jgi:hypothetical protein
VEAALLFGLKVEHARVADGSVCVGELDRVVEMAIVLGAYQPRRRWFRRLYIGRPTCSSLPLRPPRSSPGRFTGGARRETRAQVGLRPRGIHGAERGEGSEGDLALIDWEWAALAAWSETDGRCGYRP